MAVAAGLYSFGRYSYGLDSYGLDIHSVCSYGLYCYRSVAVAVGLWWRIAASATRRECLPNEGTEPCMHVCMHVWIYAHVAWCVLMVQELVRDGIFSEYQQIEHTSKQAWAITL